MKPLREYEFFKTLAALPFIDAIYLYGSQARGEADERSDVNLAILCPDATDADWRKVHAIVEKADALVKVEATRLDRVPANTTLRARIEMERTPLFIRAASLHASELEDVFTLMQWHMKVLADATAKEYATPEERQATLTEHFRKAMRYFWRLTRKSLIVHGIRTYSPLASFKNAVMEGWLPDRTLWEKMFADWQQLMPHGTKEAMAEIEARLPEYMKAISAAAETMKKAVNDA